MSLEAAIAVYATRYALGRRTSAPMDVRAFVALYRKEIMRDAGCREAIVRDIKEAYGDDLPQRLVWWEVLRELERP